MSKAIELKHTSEYIKEKKALGDSLVNVLCKVTLIHAARTEAPRKGTI